MADCHCETAVALMIVALALYGVTLGVVACLYITKLVREAEVEP